MEQRDELPSSVDRATYKARRKEGQAVEQRLWEWLRKQFPALPAQQGEGVAVYETPDASIRWVSSQVDAFLAVQCQVKRGECWELFAVPHQDGMLRCGWRRRWHTDGGPPAVWDEATEAVELMDRAGTSAEPDFLLLAAAFAGAVAPRVSYSDMDVRSALVVERDYWKDVATRQAAELRRLAAVVESRGGRSAPGTSGGVDVRAERLDELAAWADANVDRIVILPRALAEAKKSVYAEPARAFAALELLAETYRLVKLSLAPRETLKQKADELGLFLGGSVDPTRAGEEAQDYFVAYRGRRRFLEQHIGRGSSRDPRFCLRVYFFWDEDSERVVVGWLTSHLSNSKT